MTIRNIVSTPKRLGQKVRTRFDLDFANMLVRDGKKIVKKATEDVYFLGDDEKSRVKENADTLGKTLSEQYKAMEALYETPRKSGSTKKVKANQKNAQKILEEMKQAIGNFDRDI